jgi:SAM-dependent methyltransferase
MSRLAYWRWRAAGHLSRPYGPDFLDPLRGAHGLEIGGPSDIFGGLLPAYGVLGSLDGCQYSADTVWHGHQSGEYAPAEHLRGTLHITPGGTLEGIADASYDVVLASHVIEHLANPLEALGHWRRVTRDGGHLLLVAPHLSGTFDHRRPVTPLAHMEADLAAGTGEDDLTHLDEVLRLHDLDRDPGADPATFEADRRDNERTRLLHHHTFTGPSLVRLLDRAGLQVDAVEVRYLHDIAVRGRWVGAADNTSLLDPGHRAWKRSPYAIDRVP